LNRCANPDNASSSMVPVFLPATKMVRLCGRCRRGERLIDRVPQGHWKTITFVGAKRLKRAAPRFAICRNTRQIRSTPLGRFGQPDDIARIAVFLASEDSAWLTGERLTASGGYR
jgi:hypothetical protein